MKNKALTYFLFAIVVLLWVSGMHSCGRCSEEPFVLHRFHGNLIPLRETFTPFEIEILKVVLDDHRIPWNVQGNRLMIPSAQYPDRDLVLTLSMDFEGCISEFKMRNDLCYCLGWPTNFSDSLFYYYPGLRPFSGN